DRSGALRGDRGDGARGARHPCHRGVLTVRRVPARHGLDRSLRRELDYRAEAADAHRFARDLADDPVVRIPRVFDELTTSQVLTARRLLRETHHTAAQTSSAASCGGLPAAAHARAAQRPGSLSATDR